MACAGCVQAVRRGLTTIYWGLLKQPDKQKTARRLLNLQSLYELRLACQKVGKSIKGLPTLKRPEHVHA